MDTDKLQTMGVPLTDAYNTLQTFLGGLYVNDFNQFGHTWQVLLQAEPEFRDQPSDIDALLRAQFRQATWCRSPRWPRVEPRAGPTWSIATTGSARFRFWALRRRATPAARRRSHGGSGAPSLPPGFGYEWTGTTYQEKQAQGNEGAIFGFAAVLVFLFLAALYESWSIPFAVLFALPLGMFGALLGRLPALLSVRHLHADRHRDPDRPGGEERHSDRGVRQGEPRARGASARRGHRSGASAAAADSDDVVRVHPRRAAAGDRHRREFGARRSLGTAVFGGMITATLLAIFIVPVLYVLVQEWTERRKPKMARQPVPELVR